MKIMLKRNVLALFAYMRHDFPTNNRPLSAPQHPKDLVACSRVLFGFNEPDALSQSRVTFFPRGPWRSTCFQRYVHHGTGFSFCLISVAIRYEKKVYPNNLKRVLRAIFPLVL